MVNIIDGTAGNDSLTGGAGEDSITGFEGNDTLNGGYDPVTGIDGADTLDGGDGDDTLVDSFTGNSTLYGSAGNDDLWLGGIDSVFRGEGGDGNDTISAAAYHSNGGLVFGGEGDDLLNLRTTLGGSINAWGGAGRDQFVIDGDVSGAGVPNFGSVAINDFTAGDAGDILGFNLTLLKGYEDGNPFATGHLRLVQQGAAVALQVDGDGAAGSGYSFVTVATLENTDLASLTAANLGGYALDGATPEGQLIDGTPDEDALTGGLGRDTINGGEGSDTLVGGDGNDSLSGGAGADYLEGQMGLDTLDGGDGDDYLFDWQGGGVVMSGGAGNDTTWVSTLNGHTASVDGGAGDDTLNGFLAGGQIIVNGGAGDDVIDMLCWNPGTVTATGGAGRDTYRMTGLNGAGITVTDFAAGDGGDIVDVMYFFTLMGLTVPGGNPFISGQLRLVQSGSDTQIQFSWSGQGGSYEPQFILKNVAATGLTAANFGGVAPDGAIDGTDGSDYSDSLNGGTGDDIVYGFSGNDTINGNAGKDFLSGGTGDDRLLGGARWDTLRGGDGNDTLDGGADNDVMSGGAGNDTYIVDHGGDRVHEAYGEGTDTVKASLSYALTADVENLILTGSAIAGTGNGLSNSIEGTSGNNVLTGGLGNDSLYGWDGNDSLAGGNDHDRLSGGNGNDTLTGGHGNDVLGGGAGADDFVFSGVAVNGHDHVVDFAHAVDRLVFKGADYGFAAGHSLTASEFTEGSAAVGAGAQFIWDAAAHKLWWDADGSGAGAAFELALISNGAVVTKDDLVFV